MARRLFLDLDGVMAYFDGAFTAQFGAHPKTFSDDELWHQVYSNPTFFADLPLCEGAEGFFQFLRFCKIEPIICTACPRSKYDIVALQKKQWVRRNLSEELLVLPVMGGRNKWLFMQNPGDILIDDFEKNIIPWRKAGGFGIHHLGDFQQTMNAVRSVYLPAEAA